MAIWLNNFMKKLMLLGLVLFVIFIAGCTQQNNIPPNTEVRINGQNYYGNESGIITFRKSGNMDYITKIDNNDCISQFLKDYQNASPSNPFCFILSCNLNGWNYDTRQGEYDCLCQCFYK